MMEDLLEPEEILKDLNTRLGDRMFLTVREVSCLLKVSKTAVHDLVKKGELEAIKAPGNKANSPYRILKSSFIKYLITHYELNLPSE